MLNKKIKIIILATTFIFLLLGLFYLKIHKYKIINVDNDKKNETGNGVKQAGDSDKKGTKKTTEDFLKDLINSHSEYNKEQIKLFSDIAMQGNTADCIGRKDENDCISSVAFISQDYHFCGEAADEKIKIACANSILPDKAVEEIDKCRSSDSEDSKVQCFTNIFSIYSQPENCSSLKEESRKICEGTVYAQKAMMDGNKKLCNDIKEELLKAYCLKNVFDEERDTDSDDLIDKDEINKYHTDPEKSDTDGDGYSDGDEVKNGFNPNGAGKLN